MYLYRKKTHPTKTNKRTSTTTTQIKKGGIKNKFKKRKRKKKNRNNAREFYISLNFSIFNDEILSTYYEKG
jgi:hypothetical protein